MGWFDTAVRIMRGDKFSDVVRRVVRDAEAARPWRLEQCDPEIDVGMRRLTLQTDVVQEKANAMGSHLIKGQFQSDKYPTTPRGKVPLSVEDTEAQDLLWEYAQRHRAVDPEFSADLETALLNAGFAPHASSKALGPTCALDIAPKTVGALRVASVEIGLAPPHVYIAHRLTSPDREANIEAAGRLMAALADQLPIVPVGSWITLVRYWDESRRERGLAIDRAQISRCDGFWLTGPELSSGMRFESECARAFGVHVENFIGLSVDEIVARVSARET